MTTAIVVLSPGAAALAIASQAATNGWRRALSEVLGIASANSIFFILSASGITSVLLASELLFSIIKWIGVTYLTWLGLSALFSRAGAITVGRNGKPAASARRFAQGFMIEATNPKALLYFSAILPQFIDPSASIYRQIATLWLTISIIDISGYSLYAALSAYIARGQLKPWAVGAINKAAGSALLCLAVRMASLTAQTNP